MNKRQCAMSWWHTLDFQKRDSVLKEFKEKILCGNERMHSSLTGREIEILFDEMQKKNVSKT